MGKIEDGKTDSGCPAEGLLKMLAGKWKPQIFKLATNGPLRFNALLRKLAGASRQALNLALKEMEADGLLSREVMQSKPLWVEYRLTAQGQALTLVFQQLEGLLG